MHSEDSVYRHIEKAIIEHRLTPGTPLREIKLSNIFGVKRGLIRKVLARLSNAKLAQTTPNIGAQVATPTRKEGEDLFATRKILEHAVIDHLCHTINASQIEFLNHYLHQEEQAYRQGELEKGLRLSANFHTELALLTHNQVLSGFINDIIKRTPLAILAHSDTQYKRCSNHEHRAIVDAIINNDNLLARQLMDQHTDHLASIFQNDKKNNHTDLAQAFKL